jgi:hypothetical protein
MHPLFPIKTQGKLFHRERYPRVGGTPPTISMHLGWGDIWGVFSPRPPFGETQGNMALMGGGQIFPKRVCMGTPP